VNQAIAQMDQVTQQNAALVEEAAAAAESLEEQAQNLAQAVAVFRLTTGDGLPGRFDFNAAVRAHEQWKWRLEDYLGGKGDKLEAATVAADNRCALGAWIYGPGRSLGARPEYEPLRGAHAAFHRCAGQVVSLSDAGKRDEAGRLLHSEFDSCSHATIERLYAMRRAADSVSQPPAATAGAAVLRPKPSRPAPKAVAPRPAAPPESRRKVVGGEDDWKEF